MKKTGFLFLATIFLTAALCAKENPNKTEGWHFSAEPVAGTRLGIYDEIVWGDPSNGGKYKLSELNWQLLPSWYVGAKVGGSYNNFGMDITGKFLIPVKSGMIIDSDWQNDSTFRNGDTTTKTSYSEHDNYIDRNFDFEIQAYYKFFPTSFLTLRPLLSFNAQYIKFFAKGGYGSYGTKHEDGTAYSPYVSYNSPDVKKYSYSGLTVCEYEMTNLFIWTGIQADFSITKNMMITVSTEVAPFWFFEDVDHHTTRAKYFKDTAVSGFAAFRARADFYHRITSFFSLGANVSFVITGESDGKTQVKNSGESSYTSTNSNAGGQVTYADLGLCAKFNW